MIFCREIEQHQHQHLLVEKVYCDDARLFSDDKNGKGIFFIYRRTWCRLCAMHIECHEKPAGYVAIDNNNANVIDNNINYVIGCLFAISLQQIQICTNTNNSLMVYVYDSKYCNNTSSGNNTSLILFISISDVYLKCEHCAFE